MPKLKDLKRYSFFVTANKLCICLGEKVVANASRYSGILYDPNSPNNCGIDTYLDSELDVEIPDLDVWIGDKCVIRIYSDDLDELETNPL